MPLCAVVRESAPECGRHLSYFQSSSAIPHRTPDERHNRLDWSASAVTPAAGCAACPLPSSDRLCCWRIDHCQPFDQDRAAYLLSLLPYISNWVYYLVNEDCFLPICADACSGLHLTFACTGSSQSIRLSQKHCGPGIG